MRLKSFVASNGIGEKDSKSHCLLTKDPGSSLDCPLANRIPSFFDLLTHQQYYLSYSARPLHFHCLCHPLNCTACWTFITPDASRPGCFLTPCFMRIYVGFIIVCKEPHLAPISFVIKVTLSLSSVS